MIYIHPLILDSQIDRWNVGMDATSYKAVSHSRSHLLIYVAAHAGYGPLYRRDRKK